MISFVKKNSNNCFGNFSKTLFVASLLSLRCFGLGYSPDEPAVEEGKVFRIFSFLFSKKLVKPL